MMAEPWLSQQSSWSPKLNKLKEQITKISMEGELVVVEPCGFPVVVEDDPEERTFLESAQSGILCRVTDSKPSVSPSPE